MSLALKFFKWQGNINMLYHNTQPSDSSLAWCQNVSHIILYNGDTDHPIDIIYPVPYSIKVWHKTLAADNMLLKKIFDRSESAALHSR